MPDWAQWVIGAAAVITALGILWAKVVRPLVKGAATAEMMFPLMQELTVKFRDIPAVFDVLKEIVAQVRTNSGSSLKDTVNKLHTELVALRDTIEKMEVRALSAAQYLQLGLDVDRKLAERDREQMSRLLREQDRLMDRMTAFEVRATKIAADLTSAQHAVDGVAEDLAKAHERADSTNDVPGTAADAASRSPEEP